MSDERLTYEGHTPGPWEADDSEVYTVNGRDWVAESLDMKNTERGNANARLIADAPLMAERIEQACVLIGKWLGRPEDYDAEQVCGQLTDVLAPWA